MAAYVYFTKKRFTRNRAYVIIFYNGSKRSHINGGIEMKELKKLGVMLDCSRGAVYTVNSIKSFIDILSKMGYKQLQLYTEDVYTLEDEPYFGYMRGRYSDAELQELDTYASEKGIELIPCIQTLAHLGGIMRWDVFCDVSDNADILLAGEDKTYELIDKMFAACAKNFKSRRINIGMDEAHTVGLGKYLDKHGYTNRFEILSKHLTKVCAIAEKYGFRPMMWSDMFFRLANGGEYSAKGIDDKMINEVSALIPNNVVLIYWDYYSTDEAHYDAMLQAHKKLKGEGLVFAGGAWAWIGFAPCNAFSLKASRAALSACRKNDVRDIFFTVWKDDGSESSLFSVLPSLYAAAQYAEGNFDEESLRAGFKKLTGIAWEDFMATDLPNFYAGEDFPKNACKYMLYNDPFMGLLDRSCDAEKKEKFTQARAILERGAQNDRFGYLFRTLADLCSVLEIKYDLGVRTRALYKSRNMDGLCMLISDYAECERRLETFYESFCAQWNKEAKGFGFERHDIRFGGAIRRLRHCRRILEKYLTGELLEIEELEQEVLPIGKDAKDKETLCYNNWALTATVLGH